MQTLPQHDACGCPGGADDQGPLPQYGALRSVLSKCLKTTHFYETGGMAASFYSGTIVVTAEDEEDVVVSNKNRQYQVENQAGLHRLPPPAVVIRRDGGSAHRQDVGDDRNKACD